MFGGKAITNAGSADVIVAKLDPATGNANWVFTAGDGDDQYGNGTAVTSGNLVTIGNFAGTLSIPGVTPDIVNPNSTPINFIVGLKDSDGSGVWSMKVNLGSGQLNSVAGNPTKDYVVVCGSATNNAANLKATGTVGGGTDVVVAAIKAAKASDGTVTVMWAKLFGGALDQTCTSAVLDDSGNAYFSGSYVGVLDFGQGALVPAPTDAKNGSTWVAKFNGADGTLLASKGFGATSGRVIPGALAVDPQGSVVVGGSINAEVTFGTTKLTPVGTQDAFVANLDASTLTPSWAVSMGGASSTAGCQAASVDSAGRITVGGTFTGLLNPGSGLSALQNTGTMGHVFLGTLDGASSHMLCAKQYGDSANSSGVTVIANDGRSSGAARDRKAIVGSFTGTIDFGQPTATLNGLEAAKSTAYLLEM
jgi:hypothetical protein